VSQILQVDVSAVDVKPLLKAIQELDNLSDSNLINFTGSKDGMSVIKGFCLSVESVVRSVSIQYLYPILLRAWVASESITFIEGISRFESISDAKRYRDDFRDFAKTLTKAIASGTMGESYSEDLGTKLSDDRMLFQSYSAAVFKLFARFNDYLNSSIKKWLDHFQGINLLEYYPNRLKQRQQDITTLVPLINIVLPILAVNPYLLISKNRNLSYPHSSTMCIQELIAILLHETSSHFTSNIYIDSTSALSSQFNVVDDTEGYHESCVHPLRTNIVELATSWVQLDMRAALSASVEPAVILEYCIAIVNISLDTRMRLTFLTVRALPGTLHENDVI